MNEWNDLNPDMRSLALNKLFRNTLLKFIRLAQRKAIYINNSVSVKLLTRLRLSFNYLREHKCRHGFKDMLNSLCLYSIEAEIKAHYFLRCHIFYANRSTPINALKSDSHPPKKLFFDCFNDSPSKMLKHAFYFISKALFVFKIFNFFS